MSKLQGWGYRNPLANRWRLCILFIGLLISFSPKVSAQNQSLVFDFKSTSYVDVFKQIAEKTGYRFIYGNADISHLKPLTLSVAAGEISGVLDKVLEGTNVAYTLKTSDKTVVLSKQAVQGKSDSKPASQAKAAGQEKILLKGVVLDAANSTPIPFATVLAKGSSVAASSDMDGNFTIQAPASTKELQVSFFGYKTQDVLVGSGREFNVLLESDALSLDELVVVGYQTRKKSSLTGSLKSLSGAVTQNKPVASFDQALQGQVAGMTVMTTGTPGDKSSMLIRGRSSVFNNTDPLFIMDGVQISSDNFSSINPNDIETYTVLKDASATSIYGALAANGVVLITTKKGRNMEKTEVKYQFQHGISQLPKPNFDMMNTAQRLQYEEELGLKTLDPTGTFYLETSERKDSLLRINTDWHDEIFRKGIVQSHDLSLRGGSNQTRYFISLNRYGEEGTLRGSDFERTGLRFNFDHNLSKFFTVGLNSMLGYSNRHDALAGKDGYEFNSYNPVFASYALLPYIKPRDEDGNLIDFENGDFRNPILYREMTDLTEEALRTVNNLYVEVKLADKLTFKTSGGIDFQNKNSKMYQNPDWDKNLTVKGSVTRDFGREAHLINTNLLTYSNSFADKHNVTLMLGQETTFAEVEGFSAGGSGLPNNKISMVGATAVPMKPHDYKERMATLSYFSLLNYNYLNKYFLDLSVRHDGSSRFAVNKKWGTFWSVGASWQLKRENFLKDSKLISSLTLTASTGTSGNSNVGTYAWLGTYLFGGSNGYNDLVGSYPFAAGNNRLHWEEVHKSNVGVEFSLLDRFRFKLEGYYNVTNDMLLTAPISNTSGFENSYKNIGSLTNKGLEFEWDLLLLGGEKFSWSVNGNISCNRTVITKLTDGVDEYNLGDMVLRKNMKYGNFRLNRYAGVDPLTGGPLWYDAKGNITDKCRESDRVFLNKSSVPTFTGGFGTSVAYQRFSLSLFFSWVGERYVWSRNAYFYSSNGKYKEYNQSVDMLSYWKKPGDITPYSHPFSPTNDNPSDDRRLQNAAFVRLKDIILSYSLDPSYLKRLGFLRDVRVFVQAKNLLTFTSYEGFDPEVAGFVDSNNYPNPRIFTFGVDITF